MVHDEHVGKDEESEDEDNYSDGIKTWTLAQVHACTELQLYGP